MQHQDSSFRVAPASSQHAAEQSAVGYGEVVAFMREQAPRVLPSGVLKVLSSKALLILGLLIFPLMCSGIGWSILGLISKEHFVMFFWGLALVTPGLALVIFIYRRRHRYHEILREGVLANATIHNLSEGRGTPELTCCYRCEVHFQSGGETICRAAKVKGMQVLLLRKSFDEGEEMPLLYLRHDPHQFLLAAQLTDWRVPRRLLDLFRF